MSSGTRRWARRRTSRAMMHTTLPLSRELVETTPNAVAHA
jgi:hypothetical protein